MDRNKDIDNLRGLAMVAMMVIHACAWFLKDKVAFFLWNYLQWAVPVFLFCSFYLFLKNNKSINYLKRLKRLLLPYWIFLIFYFVFLLFFEKKNFNFQYLLANIFFYKGIEFNWLVLLFFYFIFITSFFKFLLKKKILFYLYFILSFASSIFFIFFKPLPYRLIMWLPWSIYLYFTYFFIKNEDKKIQLNFLAVFSFIVFLIIFFLEKKLGINTSQYANKYPPTLLHVSYGVFSTIVLYQLSKKGIFDHLIVGKVLEFFSFNSYSLYFIHILVILFFQSQGLIYKINWFGFFLFLIFLSSGIFLFLKKLREFFIDKIFASWIS